MFGPPDDGFRGGPPDGRPGWREVGRDGLSAVPLTAEVYKDPFGVLWFRDREGGPAPAEVDGVRVTVDRYGSVDWGLLPFAVLAAGLVWLVSRG